MTTDAKVVWILGAGFSRSLGGPLIGDLLAWQDVEMIRTFFPGSNSCASMFGARLLYLAGLGKHWPHAEAFLDMVETAAAEREEFPDDSRQSYAQVIMSSMLGRELDLPDTRYPATFWEVRELAVAARQAVAADCSQFVRTGEVRGERWTPYVRWASRLNENHTVLTFNYDPVPEILEANCDRSFVPHLTVIDPDADNRVVEERIRVARMMTSAPVLKLHGSVNWHIEGGRFGKAKDAAVHLAEQKDILLGLPGPGKGKLRSTFLKPLWTNALRAIREAHQVNLVGYRFPPTDANAREEILLAINDSTAAVRFVLGPAVNGDDAVRLATLLRYGTISRASLPIAEAAYAEDFLGSWHNL